MESAGTRLIRPVDTVYALPGITIVATRFFLPSLDAPSRVTLIDQRSFDDPKSQSVADVLGRNSNLYVRQYGPSGIASLSARGTSASQSLILVDGLPLVNPQLGQVDLTALPSSAFQAAEISAGAGSAQYGSAAVGSVVDLKTRRSFPGRSASLEARAGSFGERSATASVSGMSGPVDGSLTVSNFVAAGDFLFENTAAIPARWDRRENSDVRRSSLIGSVGYNHAHARSNVSILAVGADRGLPNVATVPTSEERQTDRMLRLSAQHRQQKELTVFSLKGNMDFASLRYVNPNLSLDDTGHTKAGMFEVEHQTVVRSNLVSNGISVGYQSADHPSIEDGREAVAVAVFSSASLSVGRFLFYPAIRLDVQRVAGAQTYVVPSPRFGVNVRLAGNFRLKSSGGRSFRVPTFNDWFWRGTGAVGNPDLLSETGWSGDVGFQYVSSTTASPRAESSFDIEVTVFGSAIRNQIAWTPGSDAIWRPENIGRVRSRGFELATSIRRIAAGPAFVSGNVRYSYTSARETSGESAASLRYVPRSRMVSTAAVSVGRLELSSDFSLVGSRFVTTDGTLSVPAYAVLDLSASVKTQYSGFDVTGVISILNATDHSYVIVKGYPMPPRSIRATVRLAL
ncbi:MAG: TonB-dependent receptor [Rhodothermales bacterium]|nr:TonB-dependent receptor [Rhodothermales bacterium]